MTPEAEYIPDKSLPNPDLHFLLSDSSLYDYSHLYAFCDWFSAEVDSFDISDERPLALLSRSTDELIFVIAACWLLKIPFISLSSECSDRELNQLLMQFDIPLIYTDSENRNLKGRTDHIPHLDLPVEILRRESYDPPEGLNDERPDDIFGYFHTSGSTGVPKVVPLKRRQVFVATNASEVNFRPDKNRCWLLCLPLNHIGGISVVLRSLLYHSAIYRMEKFDKQLTADYLSENSMFQVASMVPTMLTRLLQDPKFHVHRTFKAILLGGGPVTMSLIKDSEQRGVPIVTSYGMTETFGQIAANPMMKPSGVYIPKTSVGMIFRPNDIEIRNDVGFRLPANESGVIWLRGPQIFDGYHRPELNKDLFDNDGWFNTGDFGHLNRHKLLFVEARRTDLIITGGENVNPSEVEAMLESLDGVFEAGVTGVDDPEWGQRIIAFVSPRKSSTDIEHIRQALKSKLSSFKIPREIISVKEIPKTGPGKINRNRLAELYWEQEH